MTQVVEKSRQSLEVARPHALPSFPGRKLGSALVKLGGQLSARARALPVAPGVLAGTEKVFEVATGGGALWKSFLLCVIVPSLCYLFHGAFIASNEYVAEVRLTVRASQEQKTAGFDASSIISKITGGASKSTIQDAFIVVNYIKSRAIIADMGGRDYFEKIYSRNEADFFSRLNKGADLEELWNYWKSKVRLNLDTMSGIVTLQIQAYTPEDATRTAQAVLDLSEKLVNNISLRSRSDAVTRAEEEVKLAAKKLAQSRRQLLEFRNENVLIDPLTRAKSIGEMIGQLTVERLEIDNNLRTMSGMLSADSPSQRLQRTRLATLDEQIASLKQKLTDSKANKETVSSQLGTFEELELSEKFNEKMYTVAQASYEKARQERDKQLLYLVVVVRPTTPEAATYPQVALTSSLFFSTLIILWGIGALLTAAIKDQSI
ncbi:MAG: capsular polysaccharide transport system permease protein [Methylobacteriaceae bacterium]|nr:capsular polysaccharide transport system permease protein [Methylobacteriaceae bacterium]